MKSYGQHGREEAFELSLKEVEWIGKLHKEIWLGKWLAVNRCKVKVKQVGLGERDLMKTKVGVSAPELIGDLTCEQALETSLGMRIVKDDLHLRNNDCF